MTQPLAAGQLPLTVASVIRAYLDAKAQDVACGLVGARVVTKAKFYLGAFAAHFGSLQIGQCRRGDVKRFISLHPEYRSPHTKQDAAARVVACFRWAEEDGLIPLCPYKRPRDLPTPQPRAPITDDEVRLILTAARIGRGHTPARFRLALWFLWQTGCRTCELFGLDWSQYDAARGCFTLHGKTTAKTGQQRLIVLPAKAWRLIRLLGRAQQVAGARAETIVANAVVPVPAVPRHGAVFLNGRGRPWNKSSFGTLFKLHAGRAGVRPGITAYCLRHGFTCAALENGVGERQLADYLGHSSTRYISYYGRGVKSKVDYLRAVGERRAK